MSNTGEKYPKIPKTKSSEVKYDRKVSQNKYDKDTTNIILKYMDTVDAYVNCKYGYIPSKFKKSK